jgi:uncharacterized protein
MAETLNPESAVLMALYTRNQDELQALLAHGPELSIFEAAALGRDDRVRELIDRDPSSVEAWAPDGNTALGLAAFFGHVSTVRLLIHRGADVHAVARNHMKVQPIHAAVAARNPEIVRLLLDRGADPNARQQVGYTVLMEAAGSGHRGLVEMLLQAGADPSLKAEDATTAASLARSHGHNDLAKELE